MTWDAQAPIKPQQRIDTGEVVIRVNGGGTRECARSGIPDHGLPGIRLLD
jgi:hypothetical protein